MSHLQPKKNRLSPKSEKNSTEQREIHGAINDIYFEFQFDKRLNDQDLEFLASCNIGLGDSHSDKKRHGGLPDQRK